MKRSEMIEIICNNKWIYDEYPSELFEEIGNSILNDIENAGMLPPKGMYHTDGSFGPVLEVIGYAELDFEPTWEPEN